MKVLFLSLFFIVQASAQIPNQNCSDCGTVGTKPLGRPVNEWAANDTQIKSAPCMRTAPFGEAEMVQWLNQKQAKTGKSSEKVKGFQFEGESPERIESFRLLVDTPEFANRTSKCKTVLCATQEVFGEKEGTRILFMLERYGFNGSHFKEKNSSAWKSAELDAVLIGLSAFPENTFPQERSQPLLHFKRGYVMKQDGAVSVRFLDKLYFFDAWDQLSNESKAYAVVHEIGHRITDWSNEYDKAAWEKLSGGWKQTGDHWSVEAGEKVMSTYGLTSPSEDFAESIAAYRFNPKELKQRSPEKYRFIKDVFYDGIEYTSASACKATSQSEKLKAKANELSSTQTLSDAMAARIQSVCGSVVIQKLGTQTPYRAKDDSEFRSCALAVLKQALVDEASSKLFAGQPKALQSNVIARMIPNSWIPEKNIQTAAFRLTEALSEVLRDGAKKYYMTAYGYHGGDCSQREQYGYQDIDEQSPDFAEKFGNSTVSFGHSMRVPLGQILVKLCEAMDAPFKSKWSRKIIEPEDETFEAEIAKYLAKE